MYNIANSQASAIDNQLAKQIDLLSALSINKAIVDALSSANISYTGDATAIQAEIDALDDQWRQDVAVGNNVDPLIQDRLNNGTGRQLKRT